MVVSIKDQCFEICLCAFSFLHIIIVQFLSLKHSRSPIRGPKRGSTRPYTPPFGNHFIIHMQPGPRDSYHLFTNFSGNFGATVRVGDVLIDGNVMLHLWINQKSILGICVISFITQSNSAWGRVNLSWTAALLFLVSLFLRQNFYSERRKISIFHTYTDRDTAKK